MLVAPDTVPALVSSHGTKYAVIAEVGAQERRIEKDDPVHEQDQLRIEGRLRRIKDQRPLPRRRQDLSLV